MKSYPNTFRNIFSQRWWISLPFLFALLVLFFIIWTVLRLVDYPYDGILDIHPTGLVSQLDPGSPAYGNLQEGDKVISVSGLPWEDFAGYEGVQEGDQVELVVERDGESISLWIQLAKAPRSEVVISLVPIFVALIFWGIGLGVQTFKPSDGAADIFFAWCQVSAIALTAGVASYLGPAWTSKLFGLMIWVIGPLSVHLHMRFPQRAESRASRVFLILLYAIAILGIFLYLLQGPIGIRALPWYPQFLMAGRLFLALNLLIVVVLLFLTYRLTQTPGARAKIRIVALGGGLVAIPFVALAVIPAALLQQAIIPYTYAFILLGILPVTYGYAIFRLNLIEIEYHVNRGAAFILVFSILSGFYLVIYAILQRYLPGGVLEIPVINAMIVLLFASMFFPLYGRTQRFVDTIFYGGWYDYRLGLMQITQDLEQITDLYVLAKTIAQRLVDTLRLEETCVFLRDTEGEFSVVEVASRSHLDDHSIHSYPALPRSSLTYLLKIGAVDRENLKKELEEITVTPEELQLLNSEQIRLWVPIIGHEQILGLLAWGPKLSGDIFSGEDMDISRALARQLGPMIENIHLLTRLKRHANELEQRVKERTVELFNAKERVEAILAAVGDGVVVTDLDGNILGVNNAYTKQLGFLASDVEGRNLHDILSQINDPEIIRELTAALNKGDVWSGELINQRKGGGLYDVYMTIAPIRDQDGQIISYVGSLQDITRYKELDRLKDSFVADVSHELRTPTTNISLYLDLLESASPGKRPNYMAVIKEQSQLLSRLVDDILNISRLTRAKTKKVEFASIDLNQVIDQVITAHLPMAAASGILLEFEPCPQTPPVIGEEDQIVRAVTNLISNAVRYTTQGRIFVKTGVIEDQVSVEVQDTGMGIEPGDLPHIFERFYRGRNVRQSKIHGTGLGLAIVKEIVELHNGKIEVESEVGGGSTFTIYLPTKQVSYA